MRQASTESERTPFFPTAIVSAALLLTSCFLVVCSVRSAGAQDSQSAAVPQVQAFSVEDQASIANHYDDEYHTRFFAAKTGTLKQIVPDASGERVRRISSPEESLQLDRNYSPTDQPYIESLVCGSTRSLVEGQLLATKVFLSDADRLIYTASVFRVLKVLGPRPRQEVGGLITTVRIGGSVVIDGDHLRASVGKYYPYSVGKIYLLPLEQSGSSFYYLPAQHVIQIKHDQLIMNSSEWEGLDNGYLISSLEKRAAAASGFKMCQSK